MARKEGREDGRRKRGGMGKRGGVTELLHMYGAYLNREWHDITCVGVRVLHHPVVPALK